MKLRLRAALAAAILILCAILLPGCAEEERDPESLSVSASATEKTVSVRWDAFEGADRFRLYKKAADKDDFRFVCDFTDVYSFTDEYVEKGIDYVYKVKAYEGAKVIAEGLCSTTGLLVSPEITFIRQIEGETYEVEWDGNERKCAVYGKNASGWSELGQSENGRLRFENTENYTALSVMSNDKDAIRSAAVAFGGSGNVIAVTTLDESTNAVELDIPAGNWKYELSRSETKDGEYSSVGSGDKNVFYDVKEEDDNIPYWYRVRCFGDRFESVWSEPCQVGTDQKKVFYLPVLMYHEFVPLDERGEGNIFDEDYITPDEFENDLIWLKENGYTTITVADLIGFLEGEGTLPEKPILLTIDDGKYSVYKRAMPLLLKYGMKASLSVIGSEIDSATESPDGRESLPDSFCTWDEIKAMHDSGAIEIVSHSQNLHKFSQSGRHGADVSEGETAEQYLPIAQTDAKLILGKIEQVTGEAVPALAYPYSIRSDESDKAWLASGYKILLCGNDHEVSTSRLNPMISEAGLNDHSARLRRIGRIGGTPLLTYLRSYEDLTAQNAS